nr:MAG TPA: Glycine rich protein family [Caudoviricetes sp.]
MKEKIFFLAMCVFYVVYLISGRAFAPGMCALAASTCYTVYRVSHWIRH